MIEKFWSLKCISYSWLETHRDNEKTPEDPDVSLLSLILHLTKLCETDDKIRSTLTHLQYMLQWPLLSDEYLAVSVKGKTD